MPGTMVRDANGYKQLPHRNEGILPPSESPIGIRAQDCCQDCYEQGSEHLQDRTPFLRHHLPLALPLLWRGNLADVSVALFASAILCAIGGETGTYARGAVTLGTNNLHIGNRNRHFR